MIVSLFFFFYFFLGWIFVFSVAFLLLFSSLSWNVRFVYLCLVVCLFITNFSIAFCFGRRVMNTGLNSFTWNNTEYRMSPLAKCYLLRQPCTSWRGTRTLVTWWAALVTDDGLMTWLCVSDRLIPLVVTERDREDVEQVEQIASAQGMQLLSIESETRLQEMSDQVLQAMFDRKFSPLSSHLSERQTEQV